MGRGIISRGDRLTTTIDGVDLNSLYDELVFVNNEVSRKRIALSRIASFDTTAAARPVLQSVTNDEFEVASEFGVPKSLRADATPLIIGTPLNWYDSATRMTEKFLRDATAEEIRAQHSGQIAANDQNIFKQTQRALFTQTTLGARPVNDVGATIYGLWDGSTDSTPPAFAGQTFAAGHDHYLTSQSAQIDGQDLADLTRHITHHGYGLSATERVVLLVHPNQGEVIRGFRVGATSPYDFIPSEGGAPYLTTENLVGARPGSDFNGLKVIGQYGHALIVEDYYVPVGYVAAVATSGPNSERNPLSFRQHKRSEYQGLRIVSGNNVRYPLIDSTYQSGFGVAVRHRGAAAVMQVTASTTYTSPSI